VLEFNSDRDGVVGEHNNESRHEASMGRPQHENHERRRSQQIPVSRIPGRLDIVGTAAFKTNSGG